MYDFYFITEVGKREKNEDYYGHAGNLFVVADGLGGHLAGEVASQLAVETVLKLYKDGFSDIGQIFRLANGVVHTMSETNPEYTGMGTTLVGALLDKSRITIGNVGDSRAYLFSSGALYQLTQDDKDESGFLTNAVGLDNEVDPKVTKVDTREGDTLLLCTDGLTRAVEDRTIENIIASGVDLRKKAEGLVEAALQLGSTDNITVCLVEV